MLIFKSKSIRDYYIELQAIGRLKIKKIKQEFSTFNLFLGNKKKFLVKEHSFHQLLKKKGG